ncbi:MAG: hypothetical protein ACLP1Y_08450 [Candidatus Acidiferrales bacterium]
MDESEWRDVHGLLAEWNENPPTELFARAYFGYQSPADKPQPGDKFFGDDALPAEARGAPPLSEAPAEVQEIFKHFLSTRKKVDGA